MVTLRFERNTIILMGVAVLVLCVLLFLAGLLVGQRTAAREPAEGAAAGAQVRSGLSADSPEAASALPGEERSGHARG